MANRPIKTYKAGNIQAAIWFNEREVNDQIVGFKTVSIRRFWKDKDNTWRDETINLRKQDLPKLQVVINKVQEELLLSQDEKEDDEDE